MNGGIQGSGARGDCGSLRGEECQAGCLGFLCGG